MSNDIAGVAVVPGERREHDIGERAVPLPHGRSHDLKARDSAVGDCLRDKTGHESSEEPGRPAP